MNKADFTITRIHHIKLTVMDLQKSKIFYSKLPGFKIVADYKNFIMFYTGSFYVGITDHDGKLQQQKFNEKNVGLDHISFQVKLREDLDKAVIFFDQEGISHGEIKKLSNNLYVMAFRDPDNIQLELTYKD